MVVMSHYPFIYNLVLETGASRCKLCWNHEDVFVERLDLVFGFFNELAVALAEI